MTDDTGTTRWLFADQLGPHFDDGDPLLLIEARSVFERRTYHRQKAHLRLSAQHHRAANDPERVTLVRSQTYAEGVTTYRDSSHRDLDAIAATSRPARRLVERLGLSTIHPERGWFTTPGEFQAWVTGRGDKRVLMEDWYRGVRSRHDVLMADGKPEFGLSGKVVEVEREHQLGAATQSALSSLRACFCAFPFSELIGRYFSSRKSFYELLLK